MKRIYFFDIDNTLLDHQTRAIPASALTAIEDLKRAGNTVVIATGRSYGHAEPIVEQIQPSYVITQNGARILKNGQAVHSTSLDKQSLRDMCDWMHAQGHYYGVSDGDFAHVSDVVPFTTKPLRSLEISAGNDVDRHLEQDVFQAWLFFDEALDATLVPEILERFPEFDLVRWHQTALDVLPRGINKWTGCQWVMQQTGFTPEQAIAFGDGMNDLEMLQGVGMGIAMDNGHPTLKAIADRIAPALHLDGVATMLAELGRLQGRAA